MHSPWTGNSSNSSSSSRTPRPIASSLVGWFVELSALDIAGWMTGWNDAGGEGSGVRPSPRSSKHFVCHNAFLFFTSPPPRGSCRQPAHRLIRFFICEARGQVEGHPVNHDGPPATSGEHCDATPPLVFMPSFRADRLLEESNQGHPKGQTHRSCVW